MKPLRILLLSEQNNPDWVSVPLVGYHHSAALAQMHQVTLVTHVENAAAVARKNVPFAAIIPCSLGTGDRIFAWGVKHIFKYDYGSQALTAFRLPFYWAFEWKVWKMLRSRIEAGDFDVVLRVTPVAPVLPSVMAWCLRRSKVPFVIGPINGGLPWPKGFEQATRQREWISSLRFLYRLLPFARATYRNAQAIIVGSSQTYTEYKSYAHKLFFIPENGIREDMIRERPTRPAQKKLEFLFVGRLVPFKACDLALKGAAPLLKVGRAQFKVVGEGPERARLEALCQELGIKDAVSFTGVLPHAEAIQAIAGADVLVFPSVREFGGGVVFEALACGTVPIVSDYGGPGDIVHDEIGYKVPLSDEASSVARISEILQTLDKNRQKLEELSKAGQAFARLRLSWEGKAQQTTAVLRWCLHQGHRPAFLPPSVRVSSLGKSA